jgi:hypothetical protein
MMSRQCPESTLEGWENEGGAPESGTFHTADLESELATEFERSIGNLALALVLPTTATSFAQWATPLGSDARHVAELILNRPGELTVDAVTASSGLPRVRTLAALVELKSAHALVYSSRWRPVPLTS